MRAILILLLTFTVVSANAGTTYDVEIKKYKFSPNQITINPGDSIRWINKEKRQYHSVWFKSIDALEPDYLFPGDTYTKKFNAAGDFNYECGPHPKMLGVVRVLEANTQGYISVDKKQELLHLLKHDCGSCHGMTLAGGLGPELSPDSLKRLSTDQVVHTILNGRPGTPMPPWRQFINENQAHWLAEQLKQGKTL